jgi:hypothetical protein
MTSWWPLLQQDWDTAFVLGFIIEKISRQRHIFFEQGQ